ncbi:MAG: hypothetical protein FWG15_07660 [Propionibacteriaceae bacterium]|nr:hypothetical protein [Propionibacteriaceae bacterium]
MGDKELTVVKGQPPSTEIREKLAQEGKPVCLAFSCGKDSVAAWIALRDAGVEVVPAYMYYIPGLAFIDEQIAKYEDHFETKIQQYPHPMLAHALQNAGFQPPQRVPMLAAIDMPAIDYQGMWDLIVEDLGMDEDTWRADGVRAADSIVRRASFTKHGAMKPTTRKVSPIYDWLKAKVLQVIEDDKAPLCNDYEVFGRSFDGYDARFTAPLKQTYPEDYEKLREWFPLLDTDQFRWEKMGSPKTIPNKKNKQERPSKQQARATTIKDRAKAEQKRFNTAIEADMWLCFAFSTQEEFGEWQAKFGPMDNHARIWAPDVDWSPWKPQKPLGEIGPDIIEQEELPEPPEEAVSDSFAEDCYTDLENIRLALMDADNNLREGHSAWESGIYILLVFPTMQDKEQWVDQMGLAQFGMKYMNGSAVLKVWNP